MALENLATEFTTTLSGNGGSITAGAGSFNVADNLPAGLSTNFRAVIYATGDTTGEIVLVTAVAVKAWTVTRGQETTLGAPAAKGHTDGDSVSVVLTTTGLGKVLSDTTLPTTSAVGDAAAAGTAVGLTRVDHKHGREAFATNAILLAATAAAGAASTPMRSNDTIAAFNDADAITTIGPTDSPASGINNFAARDDHHHGSSGFAARNTPALTLGTTNSAGAANSFVATDASVAIFDGSVPVTQAFSDAAATGAAAVAARRDHKHGMPASPGTTFPLTNAGDEGFQPNGVANSVLTLHNAGAAVNLVTLTGTNTGSDMTLVVSGDANRGLIINPAGTGTITVGSKGNAGVPLTVIGNSTSQTGDLLDILQNSGGNTAFAFSTASTMTNGITFTATATAGKPSITATGTDTNIGMTIDGKGSGTMGIATVSTGAITIGNTSAGAIVLSSTSSININPRGVSTNGQSIFTGPASIVNGFQFNASIATVSPNIVPRGSDANIIFTLNGKGTGGVMIMGTSTNDNATAGYVGEQIISTLGVGSEVSLTTVTTANVTSITLTAGDWDVTGVVDFDLGGATVTRLQAGSSTTSATLDAQDTFSDDPSTFVTITAINADIIPTWRRSVAAGGATIYLVAQATFSAGTVKAYGTIRARRVR